MKRILTALTLTGSLLMSHSSAQSTPSTLAGDWQGIAGPNSIKLNVTVKIKQDNNQTSGTIDIPAQKIKDYKLEFSKVSHTGAIFSLAGINGKPTFNATVNKNTMQGQFIKAGKTVPFKLERIAKTDESTTQKATPTTIPVIKKYLGNWKGSIKGPNLDIDINFADKSGIMKGKINIPAQSLIRELKIHTATPDKIVFSILGIPGEPTFDGQIVNKQLSGKFTQGGHSLDFQLKPSDSKLVSKRPQEPKPPYPYLEQEVTYKNGNITLAGTLTKPKTGGPFTTIFMVTGSGPQDRNETLFHHKPFLVIADHLTRAGYAVLRVDDRGVGGSSGDNSDATYDDFANDILAGVQFLKSQPDVKKIGVFGHSEGGYTGPIAANKSKDIDFIMMMAGPAASGADVLKEQTKAFMQAQGKDPKSIQKQLESLEKIISLAQKQDYANLEKLIQELVIQENQSLPTKERLSEKDLEQQIKAQLLLQKSKSFRALLLHEPKPFLEKLNVPVLAFFGGKDLQVPPSQSVPLLKQALANNKDTMIKVFPDLNHLMQKANTGLLDEYGKIEETINPEVLTLITDWLKKRF